MSSNIFKEKRKTLPHNPAIPFTSLNPREMRKTSTRRHARGQTSSFVRHGPRGNDLHLHDRGTDRYTWPSKTAGCHLTGMTDTPDNDLEPPCCVTASRRALHGSSHTAFWDALTAVAKSTRWKPGLQRGTRSPSGSARVLHCVWFHGQTNPSNTARQIVHFRCAVYCVQIIP